MHQDKNVLALCDLSSDDAVLEIKTYGIVDFDKIINNLSFAYLFEADESEEIKILEDENSNIGWLTFDELLEKSTEPHMIIVYKKIIERVKNL